MIDKKYWENKLKDLSFDELKEVTTIINKLKKKVDTREEFIDLLKRYQEKYPNAKYFCTGSAWKGAWESEGEWGTEDWDSVWSLDELYDELYDDKDGGDIKIFKNFKNKDEWNNALLNEYLNYKEFNKEMNKSLHKPNWSLNDAEGLNNGETMYEFIEISTGKKYYLYTNQYG